MTWLYEAERHCSPWFFYIIIDAWNHLDYVRKVGSLPARQLYFAKGYSGYLYFDEEDMHNAGKAVLQKIQARKFDYWKFMQEHIRFSQRAVGRAKRIRKEELRGKNTEEIIGRCNQWSNDLLNFSDAVIFIRIMNKIMLEELEKMLQYHPEKRKLIALLSSTSKLGFLEEYNNRLCKLGKNPLLAQLQEIQREWAWISVGYANEKPLSMERIRKDLKECKEIDKSVQQKEREGVLKRLKLSAYGKEMAEILSDMCYLKDYFRGCVQQMLYYFEPVFEEISKRLHCSTRDVKQLYPREILEALQKGKFPPEKVKRKVVLVEVIEGKYKLTEGLRAEQRYRALMGASQNMNVLKGTVASPGKVQGKVFIIRRVEDMHSAPDRFVLLAPMTTPELMPILKKALAIVTDEGGLTSHAAIVSRELKIPCIVGTKVATSVFKNGEEVEVDAEEGKIRKLKMS